MAEVSIAVAEKARKMEAAVLRKLAQTSQTSAAKELGVSDTYISRLKDGQIHVVAHLLAFLGFKLVPEQVTCVDRDRLQALCLLYQAAVDQRELASLITSEAQ